MLKIHVNMMLIDHLLDRIIFIMRNQTSSQLTF